MTVKQTIICDICERDLTLPDDPAERLPAFIPLIAGRILAADVCEACVNDPAKAEAIGRKWLATALEQVERERLGLDRGGLGERRR
jgi:hypothetical protein